MSIKVAARGIVKHFGSVVAADHIDLDIRSGEFLTLLGASGCGKTTLMRMIAGFERPDAGTIKIDGRDVTALPPRARRLGMVFQQYSLFPHLTVGENIAYGLQAQGTNAADTAKRVDDMLALVQLPNLALRRPAQLSGGQQQRVALARALATRPSMLMLDEPLGALDLKLRRQLQDELRRIHRETGATFLFVTHDQEEAMYLSDRVAVMRTGRIEQLDDPRTIYRRPVNAFVADFIGDICFLDGIHEPAARNVRLPGGAGLEVDLAYAPGPVRLAVRPEHVVVNTDPAAPGTPATIGEVTHDTGTTMLQLRMQGGDMLKARRLGVDDGALQPGQPVRVRLGRETLAFDPA